MQEQTYVVNRTDDRTAIESLRKIAESCGQADARLSVRISGGINIEPESIDELFSGPATYAIARADLNMSFSGNVRSLTVTFRRNGDNSSIEQMEDRWSVTPGGDASKWSSHGETIIKVIGIITRHTKRISSRKNEDQPIRNLIADLSDTHRQMVDELNRAVVDFSKKQAELIEARERERTRILEEQTASLAALEAEREKLRLQSHRSERRRISQDTANSAALSMIKETLPAGSETSKWAVFICAPLISVAAGFFAWQGMRIIEPQALTSFSANPGIIWFTVVKSAFASTICLISLGFAASWLRRFYLSDMLRAREIQSFKNDLTRANWIIETVMEMKSEHGSDVPDAWIQGVTKGLFEGHVKAIRSDPRTEALRTLMAYTASASFGPDGPKFAVNGPQARKLAKSTQTDEV